MSDLYDKLKRCDFPFQSGDIIYDVVKKKKAKIVYISLVNSEKNKAWKKIEFIKILYLDNEEKKYKISLDNLYKRFIDLTSILEIKKGQPVGESWIEDFI